MVFVIYDLVAKLKLPNIAIIIAASLMIGACSRSITNSPTAAPPNTPLPSITPTETRVPVATSFPELIVPESVCVLPCWMGVTPGKTSWDEAFALVEPFYRKILFYNHIKDEEIVEAAVLFPPEYSGFRVGFDSHSFYIKNGIVVYIETILNGDEIFLMDIIERYGIPDDVLLATSSANFRDLSTNYFIVYSDLGISFRFRAAFQWDAAKLELCPSPYYLTQYPGGAWRPINSPPIVITWDPDISTAQNVILDIIFGGELTDGVIVPQEEATGLSYDGFIDLYNSDKQCVELNKDYWEDADFMMEQLED